MAGVKGTYKVGGIKLIEIVFWNKIFNTVPNKFDCLKAETDQSKAFKGQGQ